MEVFRPLSGKENIDEDEENKEDKDAQKNKKKKKEKKKKEIKMDNEKEEPKKELIYDNKYLFNKNKKKTVKFMLRKEVEDILNGGILLQQQTQEEPKEKKVEIKKPRFESPKKLTFIKKKSNRKKLIKKSKYLQELFDAESLNKVTQEDILAKELKMQELIREQNIENRLNEFIDRIKTLKNNEIKGGDSLDNIDIYINQRIHLDDNEKDKKEKENRINEFLNSLNDYRKMRKQQRRLNNTLLYREPIMVENLMVENYEEILNNSYKNKRNYTIKRKLSLKDLDKIQTQNIDKKISTKKNRTNFIGNKSYLTEINYY